MTGKSISNKLLLQAGIIFVSALAIILLRLGADQIQYYRAAIRYMAAGDKKNAITYFDRVLSAHIPLSPLEDMARGHLLMLAENFEKGGNSELALLCYETIRTSGYLARHLAIPGNKGAAMLNQKIASIKAGILVKDNSSLNFKEEYGRQIRIMQRDFSPSVTLSLTAIISFLAYIGFTVFWILKQRRRYIYLSCIFFVLWASAIYIA